MGRNGTEGLLSPGDLRVTFRDRALPACRAGWPKSFGPGRGVRLAGGGPLASFLCSGAGGVDDQVQQRRRVNRPQAAMPITTTMSPKTSICAPMSPGLDPVAAASDWVTAGVDVGVDVGVGV